MMRVRQPTNERGVRLVARPKPSTHKLAGRSRGTIRLRGMRNLRLPKEREQHRQSFAPSPRSPHNTPAPPAAAAWLASLASRTSTTSCPSSTPTTTRSPSSQACASTARSVSCASASRPAVTAAPSRRPSSASRRRARRRASTPRTCAPPHGSSSNSSIRSHAQIPQRGLDAGIRVANEALQCSTTTTTTLVVSLCWRLLALSLAL